MHTRGVDAPGTHSLDHVARMHFDLIGCVVEFIFTDRSYLANFPPVREVANARMLTDLERPHEKRKTAFLDDSRCADLEDARSESKIAKTLKRSEGATRQKAFSLGVSLDARV